MGLLDKVFRRSYQQGGRREDSDGGRYPVVIEDLPDDQCVLKDHTEPTENESSTLRSGSPTTTRQFSISRIAAMKSSRFAKGRKKIEGEDDDSLDSPPALKPTDSNSMLFLTDSMESDGAGILAMPGGAVDDALEVPSNEKERESPVSLASTDISESSRPVEACLFLSLQLPEPLARDAPPLQGVYTSTAAVKAPVSLRLTIDTAHNQQQEVREQTTTPPRAQRKSNIPVTPDLRSAPSGHSRTPMYGASVRVRPGVVAERAAVFESSPGSSFRRLGEPSKIPTIHGPPVVASQRGGTMKKFWERYPKPSCRDDEDEIDPQESRQDFLIKKHWFQEQTCSSNRSLTQVSSESPRSSSNASSPRRRSSFKSTGSLADDENVPPHRAAALRDQKRAVEDTTRPPCPVSPSRKPDCTPTPPPRDLRRTSRGNQVVVETVERDLSRSVSPKKTVVEGVPIAFVQAGHSSQSTSPTNCSSGSSEGGGSTSGFFKEKLETRQQSLGKLHRIQSQSTAKTNESQQRKHSSPHWKDHLYQHPELQKMILSRRRNQKRCHELEHYLPTVFGGSCQDRPTLMQQRVDAYRLYVDSYKYYIANRKSEPLAAQKHHEAVQLLAITKTL